MVTFHRLSDTISRITGQIDWEPEGFLESIGAVVGAPKIAVKRQLERVKEHLWAGTSKG